MAKIGLYADPHVSQTSSIIVGTSGDFSGRLNNLIKSFSWMRDFFNEQGCEKVICLGDMTDKPVLTAEELSAMSKFAGCANDLVIVGNHCRSDKKGSINTLNSIFNFVFYEPTVIEIGGKKVLLLPYDSTPEDLSKISKEQGPLDIILSHNDIKGYDFGGHVSTTGYDLDDILGNCQLFVNGHLHNGGWLISGRVANLGQLSGMNFSSCGGQWEPSVGIIDTDEMSLTMYENPVAYRFKKVEFNTLAKLKSYLDNLPTKVTKHYSDMDLPSEEYDDSQCEYVLQVKVPVKIAQSARKVIDQCSRVVASRILTVQDKKKSSTKSEVVKLSPQVSVYQKLREFVNSQKSDKYSQDKIKEIIDNLEKKEGSE